MILVELIGGLGNQMFQYAMGRHLSILNRKPLKLDVSGFERYGGITQRKYALGCYQIQENFATENDFKYFNSFGTNKLKKWSQKLLPVHRRKLIKEKIFTFDEKMLEKRTSLYLKGYWQSEKYFKDIRQTLLEDFTLKNDLSLSGKEFSKKIQNTLSIALHFRRGDYAHHPEIQRIHGTCSLEYYEKAIAHFKKKFEKPVFYVFSDDLNWVKENLMTDAELCFVDLKGKESDCGEMNLMSLCQHQVIANSSFSWWGAWLNRYPEKICIMPEKWFLDDKINPRDIRPEGWLTL